MELNNANIEKRHIPVERQLELMRLTGAAALATPQVWQRPIAATAIDSNTHEIVMTATNYDPGGFTHAEEHILKHTPDSQKLSLFVTKEPCTHRDIEGRTPCAEHIVKSERVKSVFILEKDPNMQIYGKGIDYLLEHDIEVSVVDDEHLIDMQRDEWIIREQLKMRES